MRRIIPGLLLIGGALACSDSFGPADLTGPWALSTAQVPGSGIDFTLESDGTGFSGTGEQLVEAGQTQPFTLTGTASGRTITLQISFASGSSARFDGRIIDADHLDGTLTYSGAQPSEAAFRRLTRLE